MKNPIFDLIPAALRAQIFRPMPRHPALTGLDATDRVARRFWPMPHVGGLDTPDFKKVIFK